MTLRVLVLGGTGEARRLAARLAGRYDVVSSLAGRVAAPSLPVGETRVGGFGGAVGLAGFLRHEQVGAVIDATHPFATGISASAVAATASTGVPLLVLRRPGWIEGPEDDWHRVPSLAAAAACPLGGRTFLTTGRQGLAVFASRPEWFLVRTVDPPPPPLPARSTVILDRGPFTLDGELALIRRHAIDLLVTKDSGGDMTAPKLQAARHLGLPVIMIDRPPAPAAPTVPDVEAALSWLTHLESGSGGG